MSQSYGLSNKDLTLLGLIEADERIALIDHYLGRLRQIGSSWHGEYMFADDWKRLRPQIINAVDKIDSLMVGAKNSDGTND